MCACVFAYAELVVMESTLLPDREVKIAPPTPALVPAHLLALAAAQALLNPSTKPWVRVPSTDKYYILLILNITWIPEFLKLFILFFSSCIHIDRLHFLLLLCIVWCHCFLSLHKDEITVLSLINIQFFSEMIQFPRSLAWTVLSWSSHYCSKCTAWWNHFDVVFSACRRGFVWERYHPSTILDKASYEVLKSCVRCQI